MAVQQPLRFDFPSNQSFESFFPGNNTEIISHLQKFIQSPQEQQIYIWGNVGMGKTHLLKACCLALDEQPKTPFYLSFDSPKLPDPAILEGLENMDLVFLDNIEQIAGNGGWEQAFFNFYNLHRDNNKQLLLTAACPPNLLPFQLQDLKTRMSWGLTLKLLALNDEQIITALSHKANFMGFTIPENVGRFLLSHYERDLPALWLLLEKIDHATLAAKRKITIPFLKQIMEMNNER